jgi:hypothetical protein
MKKEVSIVLTREVKNYRKLAQDWYGLSNDQMAEMDVHHNPPRHEGGRNIPEHLFVYHHTLHSAVHGDDFTKWARNNGVSKKQASEWGKIGGVTGGKLQPKEVKVNNGKKARDLKLGFHAPGAAQLGGLTGGRNGGLESHRRKVGAFAMSKEEQSKRSKKAGRTTSSQRWMCLVTGHISNAGGLTCFQKVRGIDTSLRERLE